MSDSDALKRPEWIDEAAIRISSLRDTGHVLKWKDIADAIEAAFDAHLATLPVADPCQVTRRLAEACERSLSWLSSYPGGCAESAYQQVRDSLAAYRASIKEQQP